MRLASTDMWIEKERGCYCVKLRDDQTCNVIGPVSELEAQRIHAHLIDAVFSACLEQVTLLKKHARDGRAETAYL